MCSNYWEIAGLKVLTHVLSSGIFKSHLVIFLYTGFYNILHLALCFVDLGVVAVGSTKEECDFEGEKYLHSKALL